MSTSLLNKEDTKVLVSVLVPFYKVEPYIERCARSLLGQTYPRLEYVFVDDCSPDNSFSVLERILEEYPHRKPTVKVIHHKINRGSAAARNTALDNASGDFICMVDSDDWMEEDAIDKLVKEQVDTNADIVSGNALIHYHESIKELTNPIGINKEQILTQQLKETWTMCTFIWGRLFRRSLFDDNCIRCKEGSNYAEDRYLVVRLFYFANKISFIKDFVYNYEKRNETSITVRQKNDTASYLTNQFQHLQNWIGIQDFFYDKEEEYYQLAVINASFLFKKNISWALKYGDQESFQRLTVLIDKNEDCMKTIGWELHGIKGVFLHNFHYMRLKQLVERTVRFIRKRIPFIKQ